MSLSELGRANKEVFVKGGSAELCTVKTVQYAPRGRKSFSNERFRQPQKGHFVSSRVSLRTTPADVVKVRCRFNFQKPFERPKIFKNCLCIRFFRCDSISYQLPLSVSGWVIEWFIVSDLEIAIASQSFASFFQWLSFTLIYICYGFIFLKQTQDHWKKCYFKKGLKLSKLGKVRGGDMDACGPLSGQLPTRWRRYFSPKLFLFLQFSPVFLLSHIFFFWPADIPVRFMSEYIHRGGWKFIMRKVDARPAQIMGSDILASDHFRYKSGSYRGIYMFTDIVRFIIFPKHLSEQLDAWAQCP